MIVLPQVVRRIETWGDVAARLDDLEALRGFARAYEARTTPHMFIIDPAGTLVYAGAIDDTPTADPKDLATAKNLVLAALDDLKNGRPVATPESEPYGCPVKY